MKQHAGFVDKTILDHIMLLDKVLYGIEHGLTSSDPLSSSPDSPSLNMTLRFLSIPHKRQHPTTQRL